MWLSCVGIRCGTIEPAMWAFAPSRFHPVRTPSRGGNQVDAGNHYEELLRHVKVTKDRVRGVVHGTSSGLSLHGRPGTAKTHMVRSTLDVLAAAGDDGGFETFSDRYPPVGQ
jgi:hypothetical protein